MVDYEFYMNLAISKAWESQILTYPNPAVGCVILDKNGRILSISSHKKAGEPHAELNAVKEALAFLNPNLDFPKDANSLFEFILSNHNDLLKGAKAFVTLEPCSHYGKTPPCALLLSKLGFDEVIISEIDDTLKHSGISILQEAGVKIKTGILQKQGKELIYPFKKWQNSSFAFFKLAMSINGVITGGIISNEDSRRFSHRLRNVSDVLIIGGNTVRIDRPILDTRLIENGKNPDVFIYSKEKDFNKSIPLFGVKNRKIEISNDLDKILQNKGLYMIEGGQGLLSSIYEKVDMFLIFHSSEFIKSSCVSLDLKLEPLFCSSIKDNNYGWYRLKQ